MNCNGGTLPRNFGGNGGGDGEETRFDVDGTWDDDDDIESFEFCTMFTSTSASAVCNDERFYFACFIR